jgi:hypothetical protein
LPFLPDFREFDNILSSIYSAIFELKRLNSGYKWSKFPIASQYFSLSYLMLIVDLSPCNLLINLPPVHHAKAIEKMKQTVAKTRWACRKDEERFILPMEDDSPNIGVPGKSP